MSEEWKKLTEFNGCVLYENKEHSSSLFVKLPDGDFFHQEDKPIEKKSRYSASPADFNQYRLPLAHDILNVANPYASAPKSATDRREVKKTLQMVSNMTILRNGLIIEKGQDYDLVSEPLRHKLHAVLLEKASSFNNKNAVSIPRDALKELPESEKSLKKGLNILIFKYLLPVVKSHKGQIHQYPNGENYRVETRHDENKIIYVKASGSCGSCAISTQTAKRALESFKTQYDIKCVTPSTELSHIHKIEIEKAKQFLGLQ